ARGEERHLRHRAADLLAEEAELEEAEPRSAEFLGDGDAEEARAGERVPRLPVPPLARRLEALQAIVGHVVAEDPPREIAERLLVLREIEVHRYLARGMRSPAIAMISRCTSFVPPPNVRMGAWPR